MRYLIVAALLACTSLPALAETTITVRTFCSSSPRGTVGMGTGKTYSIAAQMAVAKCVAKGGKFDSCTNNVSEVKQ